MAFLIVSHFHFCALAATFCLALVGAPGSSAALTEPTWLDVRATGDLGCLAAAIYYEAGTEPRAGQEAVAQVVLNRVADPRYPDTICGVVFQGSTRRTGCQFTFTCNGALARRPEPGRWLGARAVAEDALGRRLRDHVGGATHYHADYVSPVWGRALTRVGKIGRHIFYRGPARPTSGDGASAPASAAPAAASVEPEFTLWGLSVAALR